jgi:hypothetical protein
MTTADEIISRSWQGAINETLRDFRGFALLGAAGLGLAGYWMLSNGEVDSVCEMVDGVQITRRHIEVGPFPFQAQYTFVEVPTENGFVFFLDRGEDGTLDFREDLGHNGYASAGGPVRLYSGLIPFMWTTLEGDRPLTQADHAAFDLYVQD